MSVPFSPSVMTNSLWPKDCSTPGLTVHHQLPEFTQTQVHWVGDAIQPSHPLSTPSWLLPSIFRSIRVFSNESVLTRWPKYWSFSFSISPSSEYSGLISFRLDWFDLLAVQGTLKNLLQHDSSKALILWHSAFFIVAMHSCKFKLTLTGLELFSLSHWTRLIVLSLSLHNPWPWGNQGNKKWGIY